MKITRLVIGMAALLFAAAIPAKAATIGTFGTDPTSAAGFFSNDPLGPGVGGEFHDYYTFDLSAGSWITVANATNTFASGGINGPNGITSFAAAIYELVGLIAGDGDDNLVFGPSFATLALNGLSQTLSGTGFLPGGSYFLEVAGIAGTTAGYGGNFSAAAVPIPAALPMFGAALGGMLWLKRRRKLST